MKRNTTSKACLRGLNRRQRKKLRLGEFRELVFALRWSFTSALDKASLDAHIDAFLAVVESRDLAFGGGFSPTESDGMVACAGRRSTTVEDKETMLSWLRARPEVASVEAGEFVDGWYE
jgi:uncharacterized protein